jgi:hypothetical protein
MKLPSAEEYIEIISQKTEQLPTLQNFDFLSGENGRALFYKKSRRAIVFKAAHHSKNYAIRFFLNDDPELFRRYQQVQDYLGNRPLSWKVPFEFLGEGYNPMLKMDWLESLSFTQYLDLIITDSSRISQLQSTLVSLHRNLEENGIGHGNLNMKHIRFVKQGHDHIIKLIDYDSMFIPAFSEKDSFSSGTAGFQHPMRLASDFSEKVDRFSFWIFLTALEAFKTDASMWQNAKQNGFNKEEQILFTYRDLGFPKQSNAFQLLNRYHSNALKFYVEKLVGFCNLSSLENIEAPVLYEEKAFHSGRDERIYAPKETGIRVAKEMEAKAVDLASAKAVSHEENQVKTKNRNHRIESDIINRDFQTAPQKVFVQNQAKRKKPIAAFIIVAFLLVSAAAYFVWANQMKKTNDIVAAENNLTTDNNRTTKEQQVALPQEETVFTAAAISQFLSQLYQSYNKRELSSILSTYADTVTYYDAGSVTKNKFKGIIQDLFIKPTHYECNPDLKTLQFNSQGNTCKLSITISETIKATTRSNTEHYSSKIEYVVDSSFKIRSERNIE